MAGPFVVLSKCSWYKPQTLTERVIRSAALQGAHVVVLPKLVQSVYVFTDRNEALSLSETEDGPGLTLWKALAGADLLCAPVNWPDGPRPPTERPAAPWSNRSKNVFSHSLDP